jgi:hypothetical protein
MYQRFTQGGKTPEDDARSKDKTDVVAFLQQSAAATAAIRL